MRSVDEIVDEAKCLTDGRKGRLVDISPREFMSLLNQEGARLVRADRFLTSGSNYGNPYVLHCHHLTYKGFNFSTITNGKFEDYEKWQ